MEQGADIVDSAANRGRALPDAGSLYVCRPPKPSYKKIEPGHVFKFLTDAGAVATFVAVQKHQERALAAISYLDYEVYEACISEIVTGEGVAAVLFKPRPWVAVRKWGIDVVPTLAVPPNFVRPMVHDAFQTLGMQAIRNGKIVALPPAPPIDIPVEDFRELARDVDLRFAVNLYLASRERAAKKSK